MSYLRVKSQKLYVFEENLTHKIKKRKVKGKGHITGVVFKIVQSNKAGLENYHSKMTPLFRIKAYNDY